MNEKKFAKHAALLFVCMLATSATMRANAQETAAEFYKKNNVIRMIASSEPGGGVDGYARLLAKHMGRFIPGNPTFVVQNMPGASGIVAANYLYNVARKDGTAIGSVQRQVPYTQLLGEQGPQFETAKFNWLGSLAGEGSVCVANVTSPVKTLEDLKTKELIMGGSGANDTETVPALANNLLGARMKIITGYPSATAITLAMERGEVDGVCTSYASLLARNAHWFRDKKVNILFQTSTRRDPAIPDVPLTSELATNPDDKALLEILDSRFLIGRPFMLPPGVPPDRVKVLRDAFVAMSKDKDFLADAAKENRDVDIVNGEDMQALLVGISQKPKATIDRINDLLKYKGPTVTAKLEAAKVEGTIAELEDGGGKIVLRLGDGKMFKASISNSRTDTQIAGKKADRKDLKVGAACTVIAPAEGQEASQIMCE
jgi:tripartite-type tricarboxylate transporter receptor subunit TctC